MEHANTPEEPLDEAAARAALAEIGELTPELVANMPLAEVYELLRLYEAGLWPPRTTLGM